jgi:IS1 family transposase
MSEQRLILPKKPQHHKHRLLASIALGSLAIAGVWGFQMKVTFERFAAERAEADVTDAFAEARENLNAQSKTSTIEENVSILRGFIEDMTRQEVAKEEMLDQVTEELKEDIEVGASANTTLDPAVAGETTEAN